MLVYNFPLEECPSYNIRRTIGDNRKQWKQQEKSQNLEICLCQESVPNYALWPGFVATDECIQLQELELFLFLHRFRTGDIEIQEVPVDKMPILFKCMTSGS